MAAWGLHSNDQEERKKKQQSGGFAVSEYSQLFQTVSSDS